MSMDCKFEVGDKVTFREWDDMVMEFGLNATGDVEIGPLLFMQSMRYLCGNTYTVARIAPYLASITEIPLRIYIDLNTPGYAFCPEMFVGYDEPVKDSAEIDASGFLDVLFSE